MASNDPSRPTPQGTGDSRQGVKAPFIKPQSFNYNAVKKVMENPPNTNIQTQSLSIPPGRKSFVSQTATQFETVSRDKRVDAAGNISTRTSKDQQGQSLRSNTWADPESDKTAMDKSNKQHALLRKTTNVEPLAESKSIEDDKTGNSRTVEDGSPMESSEKSVSDREQSADRRLERKPKYTSSKITVQEDILCLIKKHPIPMAGPVKMSVNASEACVYFMGDDKDATEREMATFFEKNKNINIKHIPLEDYRVLFFSTKAIEGRINEELSHQHVQCHWKVYQNQLVIVAWDYQNVTTFLQALNSLCRSKTCSQDDVDNTNYLWKLYKSEMWPVAHNHLTATFGDTFQIGDFKDGNGKRCIGIIALKGKFEGIWAELETNIAYLKKLLSSSQSKMKTSPVPVERESSNGQMEKHQHQGGELSDSNILSHRGMDDEYGQDKEHGLKNETELSKKMANNQDCMTNPPRKEAKISLKEQGKAVERHIDTHRGIETWPNNQETGKDPREKSKPDYENNEDRETLDLAAEKDNQKGNTKARKTLPPTPAGLLQGGQSSVKSDGTPETSQHGAQHTDTSINMDRTEQDSSANTEIEEYPDDADRKADKMEQSNYAPKTTKTGESADQRDSGKESDTDQARETVNAGSKYVLKREGAEQITDKKPVTLKPNKISNSPTDTKQGASANPEKGKPTDNQDIPDANHTSLQTEEFTIISPSVEDSKAWLFAVNCPIVQKRISNRLKLQFEFTRGGCIKVKVVDGRPRETEVKEAVRLSCTDVKPAVFRVGFEDIDDVNTDIEQLKDRRLTRKRPVNHYKTGDAQIYVIEKESYYEVLLMSMQDYFQTCFEDLDHIISKYESTSAEEERKDGRTGDTEEEKEQAAPVVTMDIRFEEWRYEYITGLTGFLTGREKELDIEIKQKDETSLVVRGTNTQVMARVKAELETLAKSLVKVTPTGDEVYDWRFAFQCLQSKDRLSSLFGQKGAEIQFYEDDDDHKVRVIVHFKSLTNILGESDIKDQISRACTDIKKQEFDFPLKAKDDIEQDIRYLKERKVTELRPKNPFQIKAAEVFIVHDGRSELAKLLLICQREYFDVCCEDIRAFIERYHKELNAKTTIKQQPARTEGEGGYEVIESKIPKIKMVRYDSEPKSRTNVKQRALETKDGDYEDIEYIDSEMPKDKTERTGSPSRHLPSISLNCEEWKYRCLKKIAGGIDSMEQKLNVKVHMTNESTVLIQGQQSNVDQARTDLQSLIKKIGREICPVDLALYENLEADQDYHKRFEGFEKKYHVFLEPGKMLDYEEDVQMQIDKLYVVLAKTAMDGSDEVLRIDVMESPQDFGLVIDRNEITGKTMLEKVWFVMNRCKTQAIAFHLDGVENKFRELCSFFQDFLTCLQGEVMSGCVYTVFLCTKRLLLYRLMSKLLVAFDKPLAERILHMPKGQSTGIEVVLGELAKQKVDVIVNTSNEQLNLAKGVVSKSLLQIAGVGMQHEVTKDYPRGIKAGEIAETRGYRLDASRVLHCCLISWNSHSAEKQNICRKALQLVVERSLQRTAKLGKTSIAFPALGTGVLLFPPEIVARDMISTVQRHYRDNPNTSIQKVLFVIYTKDTALHQVFMSELRKATADQKVDKGDSEYCIVISGRKEHVKTAMKEIQTELLSSERPEVSGRSVSHRFDNNKQPDQGDDVSKVSRDTEPEYTKMLKKPNVAAAADNRLSRRRQDLDDRYTGNEELPRGASGHQDVKVDVTPSLPPRSPWQQDHVTNDSIYESISDHFPVPTADKGAIPKKSSLGGTLGKLSPSPGSSQSTNVEVSENETQKDTRIKIDVDTESDVILDQFLDNLTISLKKEVFKGVDEGKLNTIKKALQKTRDIKMNVKELTLSGSARGIGKAQNYLINQLEGDVKHEASDEENDSSGESDDARSDSRYEKIDDDYEQHIFERTLSKEESSSTDYCKKLKNVRREVYMLFKTIEASKMKEFVKTCSVAFDDGEVTIHSESTESMVECHLFVKRKLSKYDDFYYCDLLSNKPADDVLVAARHVKDVSDDKNDVYFYEDDGTVRLAGQSFERVTEFGNLVEIKLKGNQPRSRGNRNLIGATTSNSDEERGSYHNPNLNAQTPNFERGSSPKLEKTFRNPTRDAGKQKPERQVDRVPGCKMFKTDEGMVVYVYKASITNLDVDCIVNAANSEMKHGGGIAKVIAKKAGSALEKESRDFIASHGILMVGSACVTTAGNLHNKRVIHTVGPCITDYSKDEVNELQKDLKNAIYSSLDEAKNCQMASIGIPSVSSGVFGVPKKWCALQYCFAVKDFSRMNWDSTLKEIHFIDIDEEMLEVISHTCEVVFNSNQKARKKLNSMTCETNDNAKLKLRRFLKLKKNLRRQKSVDQYPRVLSSRESVLKMELNPQFQIAVRKGNIVDFEKKGVIVCPQDAELTCHGPIAEAIKEKEVSYYRNIREKHPNRRYEVGDVLVKHVRSIRCSVVYNVVVPHYPKSRDMNVVSLCYTQVFQKADQNRAEYIALPLFCTGHGQAIEESARALASALVELANSKNPGHKFPAVYIYAYEKKTTETVARVLKGVLLQRNDKTKINQDDDDDDRVQYHTPPTSPESQRRTLNLRSNQQPSRPPLPRRSPNRQRIHDTRDNQRYPDQAKSNTRQGQYQSDQSGFKRQNSRNSQRSSDEDKYSDIGTTYDVRKNDDYSKHYDTDGYRDSKTMDNTSSVRDKPPLDATLESMKCCICMESFKNPKTLSKCGHTFCTECIDDYFKVKPVCPFCFTAYGILIGTQPKGGDMDVERDRRIKLPGYDHYGAIRIRYIFPDGIQGEEHPDPGKRYQGTRRTAYLPDTAEGHTVLKLLKLAFKRRLVFTIGRSVTTGVENVVTWNDIHHKTNISGGPSNFGYPDPDYLTRVTQELEAKGVTEADIQ